jgi:hypothetical protein
VIAVDWEPQWFVNIVLSMGAFMLVLGSAGSLLLLLMVVFSDYIRPFTIEAFYNIGLWFKGKYSVRRAWRQAYINFINSRQDNEGEIE